MAVKGFFSYRRLNDVNRLGLVLLVFLFSSVAVISQETKPTPPIQGVENQDDIKVETDLVTLTLTVTDYYGRYVSGLTKEHFTVYDNKQKQDITFFSDTDAPVSIGILFDVSGSMSGEKIAKARNALARFIGKGLLLATGEEHTRQRALMAPGFRPKQMAKLVSLMDQAIDKYCDELDLRLAKSPKINIAEEMKAMTFRVMSKAIYSDDMSKEMIQDFSQRFDTLQDFFIKLVRSRKQFLKFRKEISVSW